MDLTRGGCKLTPANSSPAVSVENRLLVLPNAVAALWSRTSLVKEFWQIVQSVGAWPGARLLETPAGLTLAVHQVTLGHLEWGGQLVLTCGPEARIPIADEGMGRDQTEERDERVIVFNVCGPHGVDRALCLLRLAYLVSDLQPNDCRASRPGGPRASPTPL